MSEHRFTHTLFQQHLDEQKLPGSRCRNCGELYLPPRPLCPNCHSGDMSAEMLGGQGRLIAFTAIHIAPTVMLEAGYSVKNPYFAGIVQLAEGPAISAQIIGVDATQPQNIKIGSQVQVAFIERSGSEHRALAFEVIR
ncbi:MAG TPA: Zn-ribbon domain-containing OB-fold protein [Caldilineae bacterium]|nr:Zn-ribbon domain-containing OB-fold protein [Caldilineae bacterium]